jgi:hypothetical protein
MSITKCLMVFDCIEQSVGPIFGILYFKSHFKYSLDYGFYMVCNSYSLIVKIMGYGVNTSEDFAYKPPDT